MDNHPIPQDVTGFQFRLIGDMTIKQFAYLAVGAVIGWIIFSLPLFFLIKFPLAIVFAGGGAFLAFAPIGGRPADTMVLYFLKALFQPSQYMYQQVGAQPTANVPISTFVGDTTKQKEDQKESSATPATVQFQGTPTALADSVIHPIEEKKEDATPAPVAPSPLATSLPTPVGNKNPQDEAKLVEKANEINQELQEAKQEESKAQGQEAEVAHEKVSHLEDDLQTILKQKEGLEKQLLALEQQLATKQQQQVLTPSLAKEEPKQSSHVRKIPTALGTSVGTPFTNDVPNLIAGIVKDPRGNVLPNILIEVKDKDGNPVRAFKTNPLGQFASATPVLNGVYTISFEDPQGKNKFDEIEVTANGEEMLPLEVISVDEREELRRELFGAPSTST